jgi:hypothetical protein
MTAIMGRRADYIYALGSGMPTADSRCGTNSGYQAHRRRGETACTPCREAHNKTTRRQRRSKKLDLYVDDERADTQAAATQYAARLTCADQAADANDLRQLLAALGLDDWDAARQWRRQQLATTDVRSSLSQRDATAKTGGRHERP